MPKRQALSDLSNKESHQKQILQATEPASTVINKLGPLDYVCGKGSNELFSSHTASMVTEALLTDDKDKRKKL